MAEAYTIDGTSNQLLENTVTGPQNNAITWAYDEVGNRIQESAINNNNNDALVYQYGDDNRLNQIARDGAAIGAYVHNAFGQPTQKTAIINNQLETIHFQYDLAGTLIAETDGTGALIRDYIYLDGAPIALIANDPAQPTGTFFYHTDHLGTPQMLTNWEQTTVWSADYNPFGEVDIVTEVVSNPLRFPGQYFDQETGHHYNYFRDYDPKIGRYLQSDPIGLGDGPNTYIYVGQNPLSFVDIYGLNRGPVRPTRRGSLAPPPGQSLINARVNLLRRQVRSLDPIAPLATARPLRRDGRYTRDTIRDLQGLLRNIREAGFCGPGSSLPRPNGVPSSWTVKQSKHGGGKRFLDPNNPHNSVRVQPGNPNSPYPNSQRPYVRWNKGGRYRDSNGNPGPSQSPETHIPLEQFRYSE